MGRIIILEETTKNPITLIGKRAGICWGKDTDDDNKNYSRGLSCIMSNHGRTLEYPNIEMVLDGYSARLMREWYTHIGCLPTRLQASTRYIDYTNFEFVTPHSVSSNDEASDIYNATMSIISSSIGKLNDLGIPKEDVAMLLPMGMTTMVVDKRNLRNIVDMSRNRMCNRAFWEFRDIMNDICDALSNYSSEWETIVKMLMMPKCKYLGYCPEDKSCGRTPKK